MSSTVAPGPRLAEQVNPFLRYRRRLDSYRVARGLGWSDDRFVALVERLDEAVAEVDGHGFRVTPFGEEPRLATALGLSCPLYVKDDTGNVSGSHKGRHLLGVALHQAVTLEGSGREDADELAIASCGNAALAAAVVARAVDRPLRVFIPTWADPAVVWRLEGLGATISVEERRPGEIGDPAYLRFRDAVAAGATPFSVQGDITPTTIDGGRTMGWELADQLIERDVHGPLRLFVQVGGGALAASTWQGLREGLDESSNITPVLHAVQTEACAPLARAWRRLTDDIDAESERARAHRVVVSGDATDRMQRARAETDRFMFAWEPVGESAASGILDDVTYDWMPVVSAMLRSGGWPIVVPEADIVEAHTATHATTSINADATGTAGLAGVLHWARSNDLSSVEPVVALVTGITRV